MKKNSFFYRMILIILLRGIINVQIQAQESQGVLRDTLDNQFDLSNYIINMHGFVPWPVIITEPALGSFGGAMALVFMSPKKSAEGEDKYRFPDITGVAGMYTLNNSWGVGLLRQGSFPSIGMRYTVALAYADVNMNFYRESPQWGQIERLFNLSPYVALVDVSENLYKNKIFAGMRYQFAKMKVTYKPPIYDSIPVLDSLYNAVEFDKNLGTLGIYAELDYRNSMFTPDKGIRFKTTYNIGRSWTGSDFDIQKVESYVHAFFQFYKKWVCALRIEGQYISDGAPFYYYPYLVMRGVPMMRYQGEKTLLFETEQRFDVTRRWSLVGFVGTGRTFSDSKYMEDNSWHTAGGVGFRYLLARLFRLRMGVDIAMGPDSQFAYYIILGHYWNK
jgi:hypothetical protein